MNHIYQRVWPHTTLCYITGFPVGFTINQCYAIKIKLLTICTNCRMKLLFLLIWKKNHWNVNWYICGAYRGSKENILLSYSSLKRFFRLMFKCQKRIKIINSLLDTDASIWVPMVWRGYKQYKRCLHSSCQ